MRSFVNVRKYTRSQGIVNELSQGWQNKIQALIEQWSRKRIEVASFRSRLSQNGRYVKLGSTSGRPRSHTKGSQKGICRIGMSDSKLYMTILLLPEKKPREPHPLKTTASYTTRNKSSLPQDQT